MTLDIALDGAEADPEGDETARRFALVDRARRELQALSACLEDDQSPKKKKPAQARSRKPSAR